MIIYSGEYYWRMFFGRDRFKCEYIDDIERFHQGIAERQIHDFIGNTRKIIVENWAHFHCSRFPLTLLSIF